MDTSTSISLELNAEVQTWSYELIARQIFRNESSKFISEWALLWLFYSSRIQRHGDRACTRHCSFDLREKKNSKCCYEKLIMLLETLGFYLFLGFSTARCCTKSLAAVRLLLLHSHASCGCTHRTWLLPVESPCAIGHRDFINNWNSIFRPKRDFQFFPLIFVHPSQTT